MQIGYARVSTKEQSVDLQVDALRRAGCAKVFQEGGVSPNPRKFRQPRFSPATIASRSMSDPVPRNV
ncbi:recombinase family protein [Thiocystis violacea]|uniref:recombinase family protein n=1 Tax=Thiocystis violacea TaxID=13725 RepID=UPI001F5B365D|nr:recombinase family protein [Thiocystis violacea]MBK1718137.1 hypothetical protein [Thiocystis violacea]